MAYTIFQDGTQAFGIPDSPLTIATVTYIAEDINISAPSTVVQIKDPNGIATGKVIIPELITGSAKLQLATAATAMPQLGATFSLQGATFDVTETGKAYTQGGYVYSNINFMRHIN